MDRSRTKRRLLRPVIAVRRHRARRLGDINHAVFAVHDYRPAIRRYVLALRANRALLIDVDLPPGATVLDVGAYVGRWSTRVLARTDERGQPDVRVLAFEPLPAAIDELRSSLGHDSRVELLPYGLGARDQAVHLAMKGPGSTVFTEADDAATEIEVRDVDSTLTSLGVERIDLVKINIEGGEFELIDRMHERGWLARTGTVIVQFHDFAPDAHRARRRNRRQLAETHRCTWSYPWVFERWDAR